MGDILLTTEKRGRNDAAQRRRMAQALQDPGMVEQPHPQEAIFGDVLELAAPHRLSSHAAAYLELALRLELPLATLDKPLIAAAAAEGVEVLRAV